MNLLLFILMMVGSLGVVNGFLLGSYLILKKEKRWSDMLFGGLLVMLSIRIGKSVYVYFFPAADKLILQVGLSACVFIGPLFYMYLKSLKEEAKDSKKADLAVLIVLLIGTLVIGGLYPYRHFPEVWNHQLILWIYGIWGLGVFLGLYETRNILKKVWPGKFDLQRKEKRILVIVLSTLFITCTFQFALFIKGFTYIWGAVIFTFSFYYLAIRAYRNKEDIVPKSKSLPLPNGAQLLAALNVLMEEKKLYTNPKLKLDQLALEATMTKHDLSKLLNEEYQYGFNTYVNSFRVKEAQKLIQNRDDLSLEGIGYESGFNSKSSFYATFKKVANCTPAQYRKQLNPIQKGLKS